ncbi:hypothetical protein BDB00DRAFT_785011 [Zychaea mexicana]|uniref:uncharacterized protein n=1 Tax=Zychaea mexicana TaxID=64656 RepID=UPI0022FE5595|nr:uncharacterized protein BDB00DRAFT_785011 [Zychaea mexicana]KAI9497298.1 hypothetical protein BDB00DRAFT_785011 [Zychaea mexicana]
MSFVNPRVRQHGGPVHINFSLSSQTESSKLRGKPFPSVHKPTWEYTTTRVTQTAEGSLDGVRMPQEQPATVRDAGLATLGALGNKIKRKASQPLVAGQVGIRPLLL